MIVSASPVVQVVGTAATAAATALLPAEVVVIDGIDSQQAYAARSLTIGGSWDADAEMMTTQDAVVVETVERGAGRLITEVTSVSCLAYSGGGGESLATHRGRVNETLAAFRTQLNGVTSVDGATARLQLTGQQWAQVADGQGVGVMAMFTVVASVLP